MSKIRILELYNEKKSTTNCLTQLFFYQRMKSKKMSSNIDLKFINKSLDNFEITHLFSMINLISQFSNVSFQYVQYNDRCHENENSRFTIFRFDDRLKFFQKRSLNCDNFKFEQMIQLILKYAKCKNKFMQ